MMKDKERPLVILLSTEQCEPCDRAAEVLKDFSESDINSIIIKTKSGKDLEPFQDLLGTNKDAVPTIVTLSDKRKDISQGFPSTKREGTEKIQQIINEVEGNA